jgi:hypothetical protein
MVSGGHVVPLVGRAEEAAIRQRAREGADGPVEVRDAHLQVEHRLGGHAGDRGAADVLDTQRQRRERAPQLLRQGDAARSPGGVIGARTARSGIDPA